MQVAALFLAPAAPTKPAQPIQEDRELNLADTLVRVVVHSGGSPGLTYIHLHENEVTSASVAEGFVQKQGGRLIELKSTGRRLISFTENKVKFQFDPNRMFTNVGIEKTLRHYGLYSTEAHALVALLRDAVIELLRPERRLIVAAHNNENMSIESYKPDGEFGSAAQEVAINAAQNIHDFILVLDKSAFVTLKAAGFNVVLQSQTPPDDGSLSVWCQKEGFAYMNIEAGYGNERAQLAMLRAAWEWGIAKR